MDELVGVADDRAAQRTDDARPEAIADDFTEQKVAEDADAAALSKRRNERARIEGVADRMAERGMA